MPDEHQAIYFMKKSDLPENLDISKRSKYPKVSMLQDITRASIKIGSRTSTSGPVFGLNSLRFDNRYELYKYMEQFEGVKVPLSDANYMRWYLDDEAFNQYSKERNVRDPRDRQVKDSVRRAGEMRFHERRKYIEKKKSEQGGEGSQWISGSELTAGMYLYSLIVDGKEVDMKRMILTK